jgi:hypothetical protein
MATNKSNKFQVFKPITLTYKCGCKVDFPKVNVLEIDQQREFASKVRCKDCIK